MYKLTLSKSDREAFVHVGYRYSAGEIFNLLWVACQPPDNDIENDDYRDITFAVPEHIAWQIRDLFEEEEFTFPCFGQELSQKLIYFCEEIS